MGQRHEVDVRVEQETPTRHGGQEVPDRPFEVAERLEASDGRGRRPTPITSKLIAFKLRSKGNRSVRHHPHLLQLRRELREEKGVRCHFPDGLNRRVRGSRGEGVWLEPNEVHPKRLGRGFRSRPSEQCSGSEALGVDGWTGPERRGSGGPRAGLACLLPRAVVVSRSPAVRAPPGRPGSQNAGTNSPPSTTRALTEQDSSSLRNANCWAWPPARPARSAVSSATSIDASAALQGSASRSAVSSADPGHESTPPRGVRARREWCNQARLRRPPLIERDPERRRHTAGDDRLEVSSGCSRVDRSVGDHASSAEALRVRSHDR